MVSLSVNVKTNAGKVAGKFRKLSSNLTKGIDAALRNTAMEGSAFAHFIAPRKKGNLAASIRFTKTSDGYAVISGTPRGTGRPYHLFWHNIGYNLSDIAAEKGWKTTGKASLEGFPDNMYMPATAKFTQRLLTLKAKQEVQRYRQMNSPLVGIVVVLVGCTIFYTLLGMLIQWGAR